MAVWSIVKKSETSSTFRLDAEFYQPDYLAFEKATASGDLLANVVHKIMHPVEITRIYVDEGIRILLAQNIRPNRLEMSYAVYMPQAVEPVLAKNRLEVGDVVMTRSGANYGDAATFLGASEDVYACADCLVIRPKSVSGGYLATYFNTNAGRALLDRGAYGAGQPHIAPTYLRELRIPRHGRLEADVESNVHAAHAKTNEASLHYAEAEALLQSALGLDKLDLTPRLFYERHYAEVQAAARFDAEYYQPAKWNVLRALAAMPGNPLEEHFHPVKKLWQPTEQPASASVRNYDLTDALTPFLDDTTPTATAGEIKSTKKRFEPGDLVVSRLRSYLKEIAVVLPSHGAPQVGSTEFIVLRSRKTGFPPEALLAFLRSTPIQTVLKWCQDGSNHPRFAAKELLRLPVPDTVLNVQDKIAAKIKDAIAARQESRRLLDEAKEMVEQAILGE